MGFGHGTSCDALHYTAAAPRFQASRFWGLTIRAWPLKILENRDYGWPTAESLDYWKSKGVVLIRLPFLWERLQPALNGDFDAGYLAALKRSVGLVRERKMMVLLDLHNYGKYRGQHIGSETVPVEGFADVWRRLALEFKDDPAVCGYGLMNEPSCKPWVEFVQKAIDAIRAVDAKTAIFVANDYPGWGASAQHIKKYGGEAGKRGDLATWAAERMPIGDPKMLRDPSNNIVIAWAREPLLATTSVLRVGSWLRNPVPTTCQPAESKFGMATTERGRRAWQM